MRKTKLLFRLLALVACLACALGASAYDFQSGGFYYNITGDRTVELTSSSSGTQASDYQDSVINIPSMTSNAGVVYQVKAIGTKAFYCNSNIKSVTIPNSVITIGDNAFFNCTQLKSLTMGNSVTSIGGYAFYDCVGLTSVTIPNSVTTIGWFAFSYCNALSSVTIGASVTSIGEYAFTSCPNLNSVTCLGTTPPTILDDVFDADCYSRAWLRVPSGAVNAYRPATGWRNFTHVMTFGTKGDVNNDGQVNITDVTVLISAIMAESISSINADNADMNGDGNVNITDVTMLINTVMTSR